MLQHTANVRGGEVAAEHCVEIARSASIGVRDARGGMGEGHVNVGETEWHSDRMMSGRGDGDDDPATT